jgi:hypothetical protein
VTITVLGLPYGASANRKTVTPSAGSTVVTLALTTGGGTGTFPLTVSATGGGITRTVPVQLVVQ